MCSVLVIIFENNFFIFLDGVAAGLSTALTAAFSGLTGGDDDNYNFKTDY